MAGELSVDWTDGNICRLTLNRPDKANSLSADLVEALLKAIGDLETTNCSGLVLTGAGKHFCAGFDLSGLDSQSDGDLVLRFVRIEELLDRVWRLPIPTVAIAHGRAVGAGADLFAACRLRITDPGANFAFPGAGFGLVLGTRRLTVRIGASAAHRLCVAGEMIDGSEALKIGLATGLDHRKKALSNVLAQLAAIRRRLDCEAVAGLYTALGEGERNPDADLAAVVRSAAVPGIKQRITDYRDRVVASVRATSS